MGLADRDWYREELKRKEQVLRGSSAGERLAHEVATRLHRLHPFTLIALTVLGVVLVYAIGVSVVDWTKQRSVQEARQANDRVQRERQAQDDEMRRATFELQRRREEAARAVESERVRVIRERETAAEAERRAAIEEATRKERAWARFYKKPAQCEREATVECANSFIRAKRVFETKYARGEI